MTPLFIATAFALVVTVVDEHGTPVPGATVQVWTESHLWPGLYPAGTAHGKPQAARSGRDGSCSVSVAESDRYALRVIVDGYAPTEPQRFYDGKTGPWRVMLMRGSAVSGTVVDEATGLRHKGALVQVLSPTVVTDPTLEAYTDECGEFHFQLEPGGYNVAARMPGHAPALTRARVGNQATDLGTLAVAPSLPLAITVRDAGGAVVKGALVAVDCGRPEDGLVAWSTTGNDGTASLPAAPSGSTLFFSVHHPAFRELERVAAVPWADATARHVTLSLDAGSAVSGRVVDGSGNPVAGAEIQLFGGALHPLECFSEAGGIFRIAGLEPGAASIQVDAKGFLPSTAMLAIPPAGLHDLSVRLERGQSLEGRVIDASRSPIAGARVKVSPDWEHAATEAPESTPDAEEIEQMSRPPARNVFRSGEPQEQPAVSDADGNFKVSGLSTRAGLAVAAEAAGFAPGNAFVKRGTPFVEVTLPAGATLAGRLVDSRTRAGLPDGTFALVKASEEGGLSNDVPDSRLAVFGDAEGRFEIAGIPKGTYVPVASAKGHGRAFLPPLALQNGESRTDLVIEIGPASAVSGTVVVEGTTTPVADALVTCGACGGMGYPIADASDSEGHFEIQGIAADMAYLDVEHPDYARRDPLTVKLKPGETTSSVVIGLKRGGTIRGTVTFEGNPVDEAMIDAPDATTKTDARGAFELRGVPTGIVTVRASARVAKSGFKSRSKEIEVHEGEPTILAMELKGGTRLTGRITYAGKPVGPGFLMGGSDRAEVAADGSFELADLGPGTISLRYMSGENVGPRLSGEWDVDVPDTPTHQVSLEIPASGVRGKVIDDATSAPLPGAHVMIMSGGGTSSSATDAGGAFELRGVSPGHLTLGTMTGNGREPTQTEVDVAPGRVTDGVVIRVKKDRQSFVVAGIVKAPDGSSAFGSTVTVGMRSGLTDTSGRFSVDDVAEGTTTVIAFARGWSPAVVKGFVVGATSQRLEMTLLPEAILEVRVTHGGQLIAGAMVECASLEVSLDPSGRGMTGRTDSRGIATLGGLLPGQASVKVSAPQGAREMVLTIVAGQTIDLVVDL